MLMKPSYCGDEELLMDRACLNILSDDSFLIYGQVEECQECDLLPIKNFTPPSTSITVTTVYPMILGMGEQLFHYRFYQHGHYSLDLRNTYKNESSIVCDKSPTQAYLPLIAVCGTLVFILVLKCLFECTTEKLRLIQPIRAFMDSSFNELTNDLNDPVDRGEFPLSPFSANPGRVKALDTMRGLTLTLMIFCNLGGGNYAVFQHSPWNGLTVADVIFPWFVWIMGFSSILTIVKKFRQRETKCSIFKDIVRRSLTLFILGIVLNTKSSNDLHTLRILGVLQRIGVTYFIVASMELYFMEPQMEFLNVSNLHCCRRNYRKYPIIFGMLLLHALITFTIPMDDCPLGYVGPGGLHQHGDYWNCTGGIAGLIDRTVLGKQHIYQNPTPRVIYQSLPFDPEGLLGILTCCFVMSVGAQLGVTLQYYHSRTDRFGIYTLAALLLGLIGISLSNFSLEGGFIPINKNLWSVSFALCTSSLAITLFTTLFYFMDEIKVWDGWPFGPVGRNSILLYIGSCMFSDCFPWTWKAIVSNASHTEYLIMHIWATILWVLIALILEKNGVHISF